MNTAHYRTNSLLLYGKSINYVIYVQIKPLNVNYHHKPFCHFTNYSSDITSIINIYYYF